MHFLCVRVPEISTLGSLIEAHAPVSAFGRMQVLNVRHSAALTKHDAVGAREALDYMREHRMDAAQTFQRALPRENRMDEAAAFFIERLGNLSQRSDALMRAQLYLDTPGTPEDLVLRKRWRELVSHSLWAFHGKR